MFLPFLVFSLKQDCHSNGSILLLIFVKHLLLLPSTSRFFPLWYFSVLDKLLAFRLFLWCPLVCLCSLFNIPLVLVLYLQLFPILCSGLPKSLLIKFTHFIIQILKVLKTFLTRAKQCNTEPYLTSFAYGRQFFLNNLSLKE